VTDSIFSLYAVLTASQYMMMNGVICCCLSSYYVYFC